MTLNYKYYCMPGSVTEHKTEQAQMAGQPNQLLVILLSSGRFSIATKEKTLVASAGNFVLHWGPIEVSPMGECHWISILLTGHAPTELGRSMKGPETLDSATCPEAPELVYRLSALFASSHPSPASSSVLGYALICQLAEAETAARPLSPLVSQAVAEIRKHFAEVYGVEELAAQLGVSKSHLVRSFTQQMGLTPGRYLTGVRLDAVKRLLLHSDYSLEMIASMTGFSGANYLVKVFKKYVGETPAIWRAHFAPQSAYSYPDELDEMMLL